jgi:hypothetical protein
MVLIESGATLHTRQHAESVHQNDALRSTRTRAGSIAHSGDRLVSYVKRGALMPDVAEAVQHLAVVGRVRIPVLHAELRRGDEGMTLEVADLSRPLARLWARYAIPAKTSSVPLAGVTGPAHLRGSTWAESSSAPCESQRAHSTLTRPRYGSGSRRPTSHPSVL